LLRDAGEWKGEQQALALVSGNQPIGIYALRSSMALDIANHVESSVHTLEDLLDWLMANNAARYAQVEDSRWQHVADEETRISAERKLDQWLVKSTDGIFARMNRKVSIRISRQLIKSSITPNMATLFTLAVSFASGVLFACGGYVDTLAGAALSVFASILDGCDGEVARLKLQESDFGCWLETICDYLYYLFIFGGLTIGLLRSTETRTVVFWGGLLLCGAIASFVATGFSRHRLAAGRPEQLLGIWQRNAENRPSNPLLYFGRHTEFIIRRCFMPYAVLFFALQELTQGSRTSPAYHGQATLSRWRLANPRIIRFRCQSGFWRPRWFLPRMEPFQERLGGRIALITEVNILASTFRVYNLHLESRGNDAIRLVSSERYCRMLGGTRRGFRR
jgi:hypothetical protein